ncbi:MAG: SpoIIE family protein phosphatase [Bradymonadia bacterium]
MTWTIKLGRDHGRYKALHQGAIGDRAACAISVGSDPFSPSVQFKRDPDVPNEDALLGYDDGTRIVMAVSDAHFGPFASHALIERLPAALEGVTEAEGLMQAVAATHREDDDPQEESEATLLVVIFDRATGRGFGVSFGDSSAVAVGPEGGRRLNGKLNTFISPAWPGTLGAHNAETFEFECTGGELLMVFTDGIDECHYRQPETSVSLDDIVDLYRQNGTQPRIYTRRLAMRALNGVGDHPGGQDNIALVVAQI